MSNRIVFVAFSLLIFITSTCFASEASERNIALIQKSCGNGLRNSMSVFSVEDIKLLQDSTGCNIIVPNGRDKLLLAKRIAKSTGRDIMNRRPYSELANNDLKVMATALKAYMLVLITAKYVNSHAAFLGNDGKVHSYGCTGEVESIFYYVKDETKDLKVFATNQGYSSPKDVLEELKPQVLSAFQQRITNYCQSLADKLQ